MTLEANKQVIQDFFDASAAGDLARMGELLAEDATWWHPLSISNGGSHTKTEFLDSQPELRKLFAGPLLVNVEQMTAEDDRVSAIASGGGKLRNGKIYDNQYHFAFVVRDGQIAEVREYFDSAHVNDVFMS